MQGLKLNLKKTLGRKFREVSNRIIYSVATKHCSAEGTVLGEGNFKGMIIASMSTGSSMELHKSEND